ncbi:ERMES complex subunit [Vermiconidia calcicola]|uniref:ERMES complex subunit n=1 Tax=Vermiconidia calcicola TaxID=1690605 RepID=A0ACC3MBW8_9PEZI|nr:ERMES complex subunit [Vermiconidia calcicola]
MAFHFNWSPLIADTDRVRHMLTSSLNKSPKPPIIVDHIVVNELNLGSNPPSLEILEIGDLAEDRFRGIFKVKYTGDAYLTLQTRVQANPLNTFLSTRPTFASPNPLAASSGLTIPLQITLSEIKLSGFVILVFSKQKGITLVFRNDPLESLKVSSTFDSIPFVRDYLQRTIEAQLRVLFMEDLPAIIHRLSLRVFSEEGRAAGLTTPERQEEAEGDRQAVLQAGKETTVDPFASPAQDAVDGGGSVADTAFSLDSQSETYASFSQKNLLRLAALTESQRTLSPFTPSIRDTVYRAWASAADRNSEIRDGAMSSLHQHGQITTLSRIQSSMNLHGNSATTSSRGGGSSAASHTSDAPSHATRPSLANFSHGSSTYSLGSVRTRPHTTRKRKNRVVNLRKDRDGATDGGSDAMSMGSSYEDSAGRSEGMSASGDGASTDLRSPQVSTVPTSASLHNMRHQGAEKEGEVVTPQTSPRKRVDFDRWRTSPSAPIKSLEDGIAGGETLKPKKVRSQRRPVTPMHQQSQHSTATDDELDADETPRQSMYIPRDTRHTQRPNSQLQRQQTLPVHTQSTSNAPQKPALPRTNSELSISDLLPSYPFSQDSQAESTGGILEQAWMTKMATEIARRVAEERERQDGEHDVRQSSWRRRSKARQMADDGRSPIDETPPPAYVG